ncbi:MAG: glycosyltransferase [Pirellulaceae bacterium]|nr:glycosyltransferase [Pirellulaceae bacterium]
MNRQSSACCRYWIDEVYAPVLQDQNSTLLVSGWATLSSASPPLCIKLVTETGTVAQVVANSPRPDVVERFQATAGAAGGPNEQCGFHLSVKFPLAAHQLRVIAQWAEGEAVLINAPLASLQEGTDGKAKWRTAGPTSRFLVDKAINFISPHQWFRRIRHWCGNVVKSLRPRETPIAPVVVAQPWTKYEAHIQNNDLTALVRKKLHRALDEFNDLPLISIVMPVYNVEPHWLAEAVRSIQDQVYPHWELLIADDASTREDLRTYLETLSDDPRIHILWRAENGNICAASNSAAELAKGEYLVFMDNDDALAPHALFELVRLLQSYADADLIYSDEDKIDENGRRYDPQFKPDWSPELLLSYNYLNHLVCLRRTLFEEVGRFRVGYEGAQDYDLWLRVMESTTRIHHIPKVLYHWRALPTSTAYEATVKPEMFRAARQALQDHCDRQGHVATTYEPEIAQRLRLPIYQLEWPDVGPLVTVLVVADGRVEPLQTCLDALRARTTYQNLQIVVIDPGANDPAWLAYGDRLQKEGCVILRGVESGQPVAPLRLLNQAVREVESDLILLLDGAVEVVDPKWLSRMVGYLSIPGVGITGARLVTPDGKIYESGITLQMWQGIAPQAAFAEQASDEVSYYFQAESTRNCAAVSRACLLTRRSLFLQLGGFDETTFSDRYADVDLCLRIRDQQQRVVCVADVELLHHGTPESPRDFPQDLAAFRRQSGHRSDPYYNPNLSRTHGYALDPHCQLDDDVVTAGRLNVLFVTHNLNLEGAPKALYEMATGLRARSQITPTLASPSDGPLREWFVQADIDVHLMGFPGCDNVVSGWTCAEDYQATLNAVRSELRQHNPDVIVVNTLYNFFMVKAAVELKIPVVWVVYESYSREKLDRVLAEYVRHDCFAAFAAAQQVVFVSADTRELYRAFTPRHNVSVIHNGLDTTNIDSYMRRVTRKMARERIGASDNRNIIITVGTICERKAQHVLVEAAARLCDRDDWCCYLVGLQPELTDHCVRKIEHLITSYELQDTVRLVPATPDVYDYFRAADMFVLCSKEEGYNLSVLEAEAFGLPILTTPCPGVREQVRHGVNAMIYPMGDSCELADQLRHLLDDPGICQAMGQASADMFCCLATYPEMLAEYERALLRATCSVS